ncbi:MAG: hypothetical protein DI538_27220 [Azospira oryzae]|nr:MAG: hypothetical protein DI538_27220 [Azospira oryzae]
MFILFRFRKSAQAELNKIPGDLAMSTSNKKNVLVVDDDSVVHLLSERVMSSFNWINKIYKASNGREGLQILDEYCRGLISLPNLILVDLHMPIMDGFQFIQEFQKMKCLEEKEILTVVISSSIDPMDADRIRALGVKYHFSKPISYDAILSVFLRESTNSIL